MVLRFEKSWCVLKLLVFFAFSETTADVVVQDGGYQNILVTFSPDITKDDQPKVLSATKDLLKDASSAIYRATGIHFGQVVLLLPYTWGQLEDWSSNADNIIYSSADEDYYGADIFLENAQDTVYGAQPYTLQRGGCGIQGVRITIPINFFTSIQSTENERAKLLAREWIRYRYGVFYENGYSNDYRYPLFFRQPGSNDPTDIRITGCTDKPMNYTFEDSAGRKCPMSVDVSGRPADNSTMCRLRPQDSENNSLVTSSLMYSQDLPNVIYLCDDQDHVHNADVPNKQNSLCNGRSIWNVMKDHPDFKNRETGGSGTGAPSDPKFKIAVDRFPRIVLAIDRCSSIGEYTKIIARKATEKFMFDLPDGTEFSLFLFNPTVEKIIVKMSFRNGTRPCANLVFRKCGTPCPSCAIEEGIKVLTEGDSGSKGTIVILSSSDSVDRSTDLSNQLKDSQICLVVILYGSHNSTEGFKELLDASPCSHVWIMPSVDESNALDVLTELNHEFEDVVMRHSYHNAMFTVKTAFLTNKDPVVSFTTDRSSQIFQIRLTSLKLDLNKLLDDSDVQLKNKGTLLSLYRIENFTEHRTYQVSTEMSGSWDFSILPDVDEVVLNEPTLLQVVVKQSNSKSLRVRSWMEDTTTKESEASEQLPVILYAEVTMGINPVLDAKVQAVVVAPDQQMFEMDLLDNGLGDPDVTNNDGIYSRYFTQFTTEGDYQVTITISDNEGLSRTAMAPPSGPSVPCCGSFIPTGNKQETGLFKRVIETNFIARSGRPPKGYKPSRVQDLRLLSWEGMTLTFQWTSPGNEMDAGAAKEYIFGLFETKQQAEMNFFESNVRDAFTITDPVIPRNYLTKQTMKIQLNETLTRDNTYFFAMCSESGDGRQSDTSNVVQLFIPAAITSPPPTNEAIDSGNDPDKVNISKTGGSNAKIIGIVIGVCLLVIIIAVVAYVAFYLISVRRKRNRNEHKGSPRPSRKNRSEDGTVAADEWKMENENISPVNSWLSNVLVNHHEKVKEAKRKKENPPIFTLDQLENSSDEIKTISNGMLPNPIYSSCAEDLNESYDHREHTSRPLQDNSTARPNRKVSHV